MATLEELVVRLEAETKGLRSELSSATTAVTKATDKMNTAIEELSENGGESLSFLEQTFATMAGFVGGQAVIGAFNMVKDAATQAFDVFVNEGVKASIEAESSVNRLNIALAQSGIYSAEASNDFQEYADSLERTSMFSAEMVQDTASLIQSLGQLDQDGLKRATTASVELASALGIDLKSAAQLVGKAASGEVGAFARYGIVIEKTGDQAKDFENVLKTLETRFSGTAQGQVQTFAGAFQQLQNAFGKIQEEIGFVITKNRVLINVMSELSKIFMGQAESLAQNRSVLQEFVGQGIKLLIDSIGVALTMVDQFGRALEFIAGIVNIALLPITSLVGVFIALKDGVKESSQFMKKSFDIIKEQMNAFSSETETSLTPVIDNFANLSFAASEGLEAIRMGTSDTIEPINATTEAVKKLTEAETARLEQLKSFAEALLNNANSFQAAYDMELEHLNMSLEEKLITEDEYLSERLAMLMERQAEEQAQLDAALAAKQISEADYQKAKGQLEKQQDLESRKLAMEKKKFDEKMNKEREQNMRQTLGNIATLSQSGNKRLAAIGKAAAITQATIDGFAAVQRALASAPPPINFGLAAAVGLATAQNVARISGVALNKGGTVPGSGPNMDSVPAMLTPGEEVVNRDTAEMLRQYLEANRQGGNITIELSMREEMLDMFEARIIERQRIGTSLFRTRLA